MSGYSWQELFGTKAGKVYLEEEEINQVFDRYFISHDKIATEIESASDKMGSIQNIIQKAKTAVMKMELNYKLPYNEWLYKLLKLKLSPLEFAVFIETKTFFANF